MRLLVLIFLIFGLPLGAQTLMTKVYSHTEGWVTNPEAVSFDSPTLLAREILRNFESGLMEVLFSQGYICFNSSPELGTEALGPNELSRFFFEAQEGGATMLILLDSRISLPDERGGITAQGRALLLTSRGQLLAEMPVSPLSPNNAEDEGRLVGSNLLEKLNSRL